MYFDVRSVRRCVAVFEYVCHDSMCKSVRCVSTQYHYRNAHSLKYTQAIFRMSFGCKCVRVNHNICGLHSLGHIQPNFIDITKILFRTVNRV